MQRKGNRTELGIKFELSKIYAGAWYHSMIMLKSGIQVGQRKTVNVVEYILLGDEIK